jgi:hypothetical protein
MAKYKVLSKSFINNRLFEEGEIVEMDGEAGSNLELIEYAKGKKAKSEPKADGDAEVVAEPKADGEAV